MTFDFHGHTFTAASQTGALTPVTQYFHYETANCSGTPFGSTCQACPPAERARHREATGKPHGTHGQVAALPRP